MTMPLVFVTDWGSRLLPEKLPQQLSFDRANRNFAWWFRCLYHFYRLQGGPTKQHQHNSDRQDVPQKVMKDFISGVSIAFWTYGMKLISVEVHDLVFRQQIRLKLLWSWTVRMHKKCQWDNILAEKPVTHWKHNRKRLGLLTGLSLKPPSQDRQPVEI